MFASLVLHWQLTLHMNFWQLYAHGLLAAVRPWTFGNCTLHHALHLKAVQKANVSIFSHLSMVSIYLHLFTGHKEAQQLCGLQKEQAQH